MASMQNRSPQAPRRHGRIADFFIVGHPKSGTTALYRMLRRHPQIYMPGVKEPLFFSREMEPRFETSHTAKYPRTLEDYTALFAAAGETQLAGEASSSYLWSPTAAAAIAEAQPSAKIIALFREPASFLQSLHLQFLQIHVESEPDLRKALAFEEDRRAGRRIPSLSHRPQLLLYSEHVRYVDQLLRYEQHFPREQIMALIYDDFRADNENVVRSILRFLGVDDDADIAVHEANPTVAMRSQRVHRLTRSVALGRGPLAPVLTPVLRNLNRRQLGRIVALRDRLLVRGPNAADDELLLELRRRFAPEVAALSDHLGRDLVSLWGYDRLG